MSELIVFTVNGKTYFFKGVENFREVGGGFAFDYTGVATGVTRSAKFSDTSVAGYALTQATVKKKLGGA